MNIEIKPQGFISKCLDVLFIPIMYMVQFPSLERPQETHRWNNHHFSAYDVHDIDITMVVRVDGGTDNSRRWRFGLPVFHMPILGGWRQFVVVEPNVAQDEWYIGWIANDLMGVSRIPLKTPVRLLIKSGQTLFFGVNEHGEQIAVQIIGKGKIGEKHRYTDVPLR